MWKLVLVAFAVTLLGGSRAHAQDAYLGPQLGVFNSKDADDAKLMGGAALRLKLSPGLGIEGSIDYRREDYAGKKVSVTSWPVMVTGLLYPFPTVYGAIGAGWYNTTFDYDKGKIGREIQSETKQKFGWHFGAGVEVPVGSRSKIAADIRYVFLNYDFQQFPGSSGLSANFYAVTLGVLLGL